jgi:hypothetical protein
MHAPRALIPAPAIQRRIHDIRGQRVLLDEDLAILYGVTVKRLNEQVKRNRRRFPADFMFRLTRREVSNLRSQFATSSAHGGRRHLPYAFTEHGAVMLASVLNSRIAVSTSVQIVRAFLRLREMVMGYRELGRKLSLLEQKYDKQFRVVFVAIRELMEPPEPRSRPRIGFRKP